MISVRRRLGVLLLAVVATMFSLMLLSTSSGAQTSGLDPAEDECDVVGTGDSAQQSLSNGNEDNSDQQTQENPSETGLQQSQQNEDEGDRPVQDEGDQQAQDQNTIDELLAQNETEDGNLQQAQQNETGDNGDPAASQDGESTSPSSDAGEEDECDDVIADTVPDELLPPTGAPVKPPTGDPAAEKERKSNSGEKKSGNDEKKSNGGEKKKKSVGDEQKSGAQKKSGSQSKPDRVEKLKVDGRPGKESGREKTEARSRSATAQKQVPGRSLSSRKKKVTSENRSRRSAPDSRREKSETFSRPASAPDLAPVLATGWSRPFRGEVAAASKPRRFAPDPDAEMTLSARALGVYDVPVASSDRLEELDQGLVHMPKSSLPWDRGEQRNVYIAGHYLGHPGTPSRLVFYNLDKLKKGDELVLKDGQGQPYKYRVSEKLEVEPNDSWVMGQVRNRDMVTLQTCIPPDFGKRLVVRADRV